MNLIEQIGQEIRVSIAMSLSDDEESKKAGESTTHNVTFIIPKDWTVQDLVNRMFSASSPRVTFQNKYRGKDTVPKEWTVNKAGARTVVDTHAAKVEMLIAAGFPKELAERCATSPELLRKAINNELQPDND